MEVIGIGDLHLGKLDNLILDVNSLIVKSLSKVFDYALEHGVMNIIQYGDVGEKPRLSYESQVALYTLLGRKKYRDLKIHFVLGNHDFAEDGTHTLQVLDVVSKWAGASNIKVYTKPELVDIDGVPFNFLPYPFTHTKKQVINVGHFEVSGSIRDNGRKIDEGIDTKHTSLVGHLHTKHRVRNTHYSGTLYQTNFGESLPKFFHHVRLDKKAPVSEIEVECVKFNPLWRLLNETINSVKDLDRLEHEPLTLYKLFLKEGLDVDINQILTDYPNVVRHNVFKNKKDLEILTTREWNFDAEVVTDDSSFDELEAIKEFMSTSGLKKSQVSRGLVILKGIRKQYL
jgi:DNA repair exonuclease SbcCD nuclease subunit